MCGSVLAPQIRVAQATEHEPRSPVVTVSETSVDVARLREMSIVSTSRLRQRTQLLIRELLMQRSSIVINSAWHRDTLFTRGHSIVQSWIWRLGRRATGE